LARKIERTSMSSSGSRRRRPTGRQPGSGPAGQQDRGAGQQRRGGRAQDWENRFGDLRRALGYTTTQVAELLGVSRDTVLKWENGKIGDPGRHDQAVRDRLVRILGLARTPWFLWIIDDDGGLAEALRHVDADAVLAAKAGLDGSAQLGESSQVGERSASGEPASPHRDRWTEVTAPLGDQERALLVTVGRDVRGDALARGLDTMVAGLTDIRDEPTFNDLRWLAQVWIAACAEDVPDAFARLEKALRVIAARGGGRNGGG
jgi:transcriptional regulator with XRE-family HTH domain